VSEPFVLRSTPLAPLEIRAILKRGSGALERYLGDEIYANTDEEYLSRQRERMIATMRLHAVRVGTRPTYLLRAPGRLNAFLEYLDMCAGDHMSTTMDGDIPVAVSPREDDIVTAVNSHPLFPPGKFSIAEEIALFKSAPWAGSATAGLHDDWDTRTRVYPCYKRTQGDWLNYIRCPFLRVAWELPGVKLHGVDMTFGPSTVLFRAGTSSSSAMVVLSFLALYLANHQRLPRWDIGEVCELLGEAEWYVGTHGGANDHTTILRNLPNGVLYNRHSLSPLDSTQLPSLRGVRIVLANSLWEANKCLGANHNFNLRKGWMDLGHDLMLMIIQAVREHLEAQGETSPGWLAGLLRQRFGFAPEREPRLLESRIDLWDSISARYARFGSLVEDLLGIPDGAIEELIGLLPAEISPEDAGRILGKDRVAMERDYALPDPDECGYRIRSAATFFHKENRIGRELERILLEADRRLKSGETAEDSAAYDMYRWEVGRLLEELQNTIRDDFQISNDQLELLLDIARRGPGYLGGKLTGAGSGGCVSILVREGSGEAFCEYLDEQYYGKPENFQRYRATLDRLESASPEGSPDRETAREMIRTLEESLGSIPDQRRVVTFGRGACIVEADRFRP